MNPAIVPLTMPQWGLTMTEGKVTAWLKPQGATLAAGEEVLDIETSKIANAMEAPAAGVLARVVAPEGTTLPVGALLGVLTTADVPEAELDAFVAGFVVPEPAEAAAEEAGLAGPTILESAVGPLRYLERGAGPGPAIVLLHGLGGDLNTWMFTQPALAERFRTVALDLPGHGGSTKNVEAGDLGFFAAAVEDALTRLGLERVHLVGHSMGGGVAARVATRWPERVASLSLIAPAGLGPEINAAFLDGFVHATRRKDVAAALASLVHDPALVSRTMVEDTLRYKRLDGVAEALTRIVGAWFPGGRQALALAQEIAALAVPVQVIWGSEDRIIPPAHAAALGPPVACHIVDGAGHLPHMERAAEVNRLIAGFVG